MPLSPRSPNGATPPSESALEALARARRHLRSAAGELFAAARALLDAGSLGLSGQPSDAHDALRSVGRALDDLARRLDDGSAGVPAPVINAVVDALDSEIARWEKRSAEDPEARAVLRTFLGLREILWEFGLRRAGEEAPSPAAGDRLRTRARATRRGPSESESQSQSKSKSESPDRPHASDDGPRREEAAAGDGAAQRRAPTPRVQRVNVEG